MLASGGDKRITVPGGGNTNIYGASPFPRSTLGYASSTANDISLDAFRHLEAMVGAWPPAALLSQRAYRDALEGLRARIRAAWELDADTDIVFAPSGTDLEYVALSLAADRAAMPVTNLLLGQDEVGSGCILSAAGRYFAGETAVSGQVPRGEWVAGFEGTEVVSIPVRDPAGAPVESGRVADEITARAEDARRAGHHPLAHVVCGSKTGLVLPAIPEVDALISRHGERLSIVVDACQARVEGTQLRTYLDRGCIILLTGSKFMGGPPFSGFALVPPGFRPHGALPSGLATIFRRAEWPGQWRGCDHLPDTANPGLLLRLEAALFELERYLRTDSAARDRVIAAFGSAVRALAVRLGVELICPGLDGNALCESTLATLDLSTLPGRPDLGIAQRWHRVLAARGLRLGQPVKCLRNAHGDWAGTLRISLSMPLITGMAFLDEGRIAARFDEDMAQIARVLEAAYLPVMA